MISGSEQCTLGLLYIGVALLIMLIVELITIIGTTLYFTSIQNSGSIDVTLRETYSGLLLHHDMDHLHCYDR